MRNAACLLESGFLESGGVRMGPLGILSQAQGGDPVDMQHFPWLWPNLRVPVLYFIDKSS